MLPEQSYYQQGWNDADTRIADGTAITLIEAAFTQAKLLRWSLDYQYWNGYLDRVISAMKQR